MKTMKLAAIATLLSSSALALGTTAHADTASKATSENHIIFKASTKPTDPLDPIDPDNPNPPVDPADPGNGGTGNEGPLTINYTSNIEFGEQEITSGTQVYNAKNENPYVQVSDNRGTGAGWKLSATASKFTSADSSKVLKGAELSFKDGEVKTKGNNVSKKAVHHDVIFNNTDAKVLMDADVDGGRGTWIDVFSGEAGNNDKIQLKVLEGSADAGVDYTATINWELADAPK
ncbi:WxL domain-containing protein [Bacillus paramobilis]|uniref:WxL domain-containing protein n=1 Tax=Bacillus paramobilis TaxID=2817477 RepID=UPI003D1E9458